MANKQDGKIVAKKDNACNPPLCIRRITRQQQSGDYRFELQWRTAAGVITTKGWRWIRAHNRIQAPMCNGHHIFSCPANVRAAVRNLFTRLMREQKGLEVPSIGGRKKKAKPVDGERIGVIHAESLTKTENHLQGQERGGSNGIGDIELDPLIERIFG